MIVKIIVARQGVLGDETPSETYTGDLPVALICEDAAKAMAEFLPRQTFGRFISVSFHPPSLENRKEPFLAMGYEDEGEDIYWTYWYIVGGSK